MNNKLFIPGWMNILANFEEGVSKEHIARKVDTTTSNCWLVINAMIDKNLIIRKEKIGRLVPLKLTEEGKKLREYCIQSIKILK